MYVAKWLLLILTCVGLVSCKGGSSTFSATSGQTGDQQNGSGVTITAKGTRAFEISPQRVQLSQTYKDGSFEICSGIAIAPGHFLSAAHCFPQEVTSSTLISNGVGYAVDEIILHPDFYFSPEASAFFNDVAIVKSKTLSLPTLPLISSLSLAGYDDISIMEFISVAIPEVDFN